MTVRPMVTTDTPAVQAMAARFLSPEGPYGDRFTADPTRIAALVDQMADPHALGLIAEDDGRPVGMFGAFCFAHPILGEVTAAELCWWVEPEARGSRLALTLLHAAERWATAQGAAWMEMIAPNERVAAFYARVGYERTDVHYLKRL